MKNQVTESRRVLKAMNARADRAADSQAGPADAQLTNSRRTLDRMNDAADRAADSQVARSTPMAPQ